MYNYRWFYLSLFLVAGVCFCGSTNEFVVKKNDKRTPSASQMKDDICQKILDTLEETPSMLRSVAHVHEELVMLSKDILNDNCLGACAKQDISVGHEHALKMYEHAQHIVHEMYAWQQEVAALRKKVSKE